MRERRVDSWIVVPLIAVAVIAAIDVLAGPDAPLIGALVVAPLLACTRLDGRHTGAVALVAILAGLLLGVPNEFFLESVHFPRMLPVVIAGIVAVWFAVLRAQRERAALFLSLQASVSRTLNEARTVEDALSRLLPLIGEGLGWQLGGVWRVDREAACLRRVESWRVDGFEAPAFEAASREMALEPGVSLPGRVWERDEAVFLSQLRPEEGLPRAEVAIEAGLTNAFAFPVRAGESVVGVVEFLGTRARRLERAQLDMFSGLGRQIGEFMERRRVEAERAELLERERAARLDAERAEQRAGDTAALLDTLLGRAPVGFAYVDAQLRYVRVNDALAALAGHSPTEIIGRSVSEVLPELPQVEHTLRRVIATGEPVTDIETSGEAGGEPGVERHWIQSYYPVRGHQGDVVGVGAVVVEITDRKRAEKRATFLAEATAVLAASLDYEVTLGNIARLTVPHLADWCVVDLVEPDGHHLRRLAIAHSDPAKERLVWELDRRYPADLESDVGPAAAIRTSQPQLYEHVDDALLRSVAQDEDHLRILRQLGFVSAMAVPLTARGESFGALTFVSAESGRLFDAADLALAVELGARAAVAMENARLYRERSHIARTLQESLLPPRLPELPGVELAARHRAAGEANDVGGDFYDVFPTGDRTWGAVVGDVLGKGARAAAMIGLARHTLRAAAMREPDSVTILTTLNEALYREGAVESFCTAVYLAFEVTHDAVEVEVTCAGHPLPLVVRADGTIENAGMPGTLLGAVPRLVLEPGRISLGAGDTLVVFTDGVVEARSEEGVLGEKRLRRLLRDLPGVAAREVAERVARIAIDFQAGRPRDDLAVLVARRHTEEAPPPPSGSAAPRAIGTDA